MCERVSDESNRIDDSVCEDVFHLVFVDNHCIQIGTFAVRLRVNGDDTQRDEQQQHNHHEMFRLLRTYTRNFASVAAENSVRRSPAIEVPTTSQSIHKTVPLTSTGWCPPLGRNESLPYFVKRSSTGNLPVYLKIRNAGTRITTHVKGISGDAEQFRATLTEALPNVVIKSNISSLELKGNHVQYLKKFLLTLGF